MPAPRTYTTSAIILKRINFSEADRIINVITPDHGKLGLIAKGVRKSTSKLAGGIELFSVSNISVIPGKKDLSTLVSTKLVTHYSNIVKELERTNVGYTILTSMESATQESCGPEFYQLLLKSLSALNQTNINQLLVEAWFYMNLLKISGHEPNLTTDREGYSLSEKSRYNFDNEAMCFARRSEGAYDSLHIKLLRLLATEPIEKISTIAGIGDRIIDCQRLLQRMTQNND